ncbi:uncharacterized protein LOC134675549 isoform X2 [Cydia fagiglandana]
MVRNSAMCCVPNCGKTRLDNVILHKFPCPINEADRFRTWIYSVGGDVLSLDNQFIHKYRKVCHIHFKEKYINRSGRLSDIAIPTLHLKVFLTICLALGGRCPKKIMTEKACCVPGCYSSRSDNGVILHVFPNPIKTEKYLLWAQAAGPEVLSLDPHFVYKRRRICHIHFETKYLTNTRRLTHNAVPTLYIDNRNSKSIESAPNSQEAETRSEHWHSNTDNAPQQPIDLQPTEERHQLKLDLAAEIGELNDLIEAHPSDNEDLPPSPIPPEISENIPETNDSNETEGEKIFSWQKAELIETVVPDQVEYLCQDCAVVIEGFLFWCVQCACGPLCVACAGCAPHSTHYVLRAPEGATLRQTRAVLAAIRHQLLKENLLTLYEIDEKDVKVEVKPEPEERPLPPSLLQDPLDLEPRLDAEPHYPASGQQSGEFRRESSPEVIELKSETVELQPEDIVIECVNEETVDRHPFKRPRLMNHRTGKLNTTKGVQQRSLLKTPPIILKGSQTLTDLTPGYITELKPRIKIPSDSPGSQSGIKILSSDRTGSQSDREILYSNGTITLSAIKNLPSDGSRTQSGIESLPSDGSKTQSGIKSLSSDDSRTQSGIKSLPSDGSRTQSGIKSLPSDGSRTQSGTKSLPSDGSRTQSGIKSLPSDGSRTQSGIKSLPSDGSRTQLGIKSLPSDGSRIESGIKSLPSDGSRTHSGIKIIPSDCTVSQPLKKVTPSDTIRLHLPSHLGGSIILQKIQPSELISEMTLNLKKVQSVPKGASVLKLPQNPKGLKLQLLQNEPPNPKVKVSNPLKDPQSESVINLEDVVSEEIEILDEELLAESEYEQDRLEIENLEDEEDSEIDKSRFDKDKIDQEVIDYLESEMDDSDLDKDYRIDEERIDEDSIDETDVEDITGGVGRRTRNTTKSLRAHSEVMRHTLTSEAAVQLQPLTSLDIRKWSAEKRLK